MYAIVWEYEVAPGAEERFVDAYGRHGAWAKLFGRAPGFVGTVLLKDPQLDRYVTIDFWRDAQRHAAFMASVGAEYAMLDAQFTPLTVRQRRVGTFNGGPTCLDGARHWGVAPSVLDVVSTSLAG